MCKGLKVGIDEVRDYLFSVNIKLNQLRNTDSDVKLESPFDCKEIQPVHPKGDPSWVFIGRTDAEAPTPILWPPHVKN